MRVEEEVKSPISFEDQDHFDFERAGLLSNQSSEFSHQSVVEPQETPGKSQSPRANNSIFFNSSVASLIKK